MSGSPKFLIAEKDGVEFITPTEYVPDASDIVFNPGISQQTLRDKIDNLILTGDDNFTYKKIISGQTISVPENQQMLVHQDLFIALGGELVIDCGGEVVIC